MGKVKKYALSNAPAFYYSPRWSPDGKRIAYTDNFLKLRVLTLDTGAITEVATNTYMSRSLDPVWSPDSKWLAYTKVLKNHLNAAFLYSLEEKKSRQITGGEDTPYRRRSTGRPNPCVRSMRPCSPKVDTGLPVCAFKQIW